jgi:hypothetical protein
MTRKANLVMLYLEDTSASSGQQAEEVRLWMHHVNSQAACVLQKDKATVAVTDTTQIRVSWGPLPESLREESCAMTRRGAANHFC